MKKFYILLLMALAGTTQAFAQWNTNATPKCIFDATDKGDYYACNPKVVRTPDKKTWIAWKTARSFERNGAIHSGECTYLQLLDINGVPLFEQPILVNDHVTPSWWSEYALCLASDGSAIITVADSRTEESTIPADQRYGYSFTPAIYKVDQEGNFLWGLDGIDYPNITNGAYTTAFVVGDDTYFIFIDTNESSTAGATYIQRIDADGVTAWDEPRKQRDEPYLQYKIVPSLDGDLLFFDHTADGARVQRLNRDLEDQWGGPVIYDENKYDGYEMNHYRILSDGNGGACVAFLRNMGQFSHNVRVQHINEDSSLGFGLTGLDTYHDDAYDHNYPRIAVNPETQEILVQFASDLGSTGNVMHQKFSFDGDYLYDELAMSIASKNSSTNSYFFGIVGVGALSCGDWICCYRDIVSYNTESFVIRRYDKEGNRVWTKTIGRDLGPNDTKFFVEEEAAYLFYRETRANKEPGIKIFRIGADGTYDVNYTDGITSVDDQREAGIESIYTLDGKQVKQLQRGLNVVKYSDGTVGKRFIK